MQIEFGMLLLLTISANTAFMWYISIVLRQMQKRFNCDIMQELFSPKKNEEETVIEKFKYFGLVTLINLLFFFDTFFSISFQKFIGFCIVTVGHLLLLLIFIATKETFDRRSH